MGTDDPANREGDRDGDGGDGELGAIIPTRSRRSVTPGLLLQAQRKCSLAFPFLRRALERHLGRDHPNTLTSVNNLGSLLLEQGLFKEAQVYYCVAALSKDVSGHRGPITRSTRSAATDLGILLKKTEEDQIIMGRL